MKTLCNPLSFILAMVMLISPYALAEPGRLAETLGGSAAEFGNKSEARDKLDDLVSQGRIKAEDAEKAKDELEDMNRDDFQDLKDKANVKKPDSSNKPVFAPIPASAPGESSSEDKSDLGGVSEPIED